MRIARQFARQFGSLAAVLAVCAALAVHVPEASATTLEQLSLQQMAELSTSVVRGKVLGTFTARYKGNVYTFYHVQVIENLKSQMQSTVDVAVPGGKLDGLEHAIAGAPKLATGSEYVLFLWTSKSGLTQIIGLSQGALDVRTGPNGEMILLRAPVTEQMLDAQGRVVRDRGLSMGMEEMRQRMGGGR